MFLYLFIPLPSVDTKLPLSQCTVIKALTVLPPEGSPHAPPKLWSSLCDTKHVLPGAGQQQSRCPTLANRLGPQHSSGNWDTQLCLLKAAAMVVQGSLLPSGWSEVSGMSAEATCCKQGDKDSMSLWEGWQVPATPGQRWFREPAPGLAFVKSLDRQASICMKIDFRKPLKCNKKVFNAPAPTELISTSLLDLSFLFLLLPSLGIALLHKQPIWKTAQPGNT